MSRLRLQPTATTFWIGLSRSCQRATPSSGARPCSTKCSVPPGLSTRRTSRSAATASGIVHSVHVLSTASADSSSNGSRCPSSPAISTCTGDAAIRPAASFAPVCIGSTARSRVTSGGRNGRLWPVPNPISTTSPARPAQTRCRFSRVVSVSMTRLTNRGNTTSR